MKTKNELPKAASGAELDRWLALYGKSRLPGETDESARARLLLKLKIQRINHEN